MESRYFNTFVGERQWHRVVTEVEGFARLEGFFGAAALVLTQQTATPNMNCPTAYLIARATR
jgi:hypothetical protein